ncbi:carboxypeptidase-like regulatory domain-containing protein [Flavobacterium sp. J27]|uniref:carboxypeptidase-like regulatory domain-containing protein n=1 Tax=Flavobacterium sp. J27 TaxID=2060419 RepID=UPI0010314BA1|nr:carboxypeptidase-like regulatory domain-containing protein [Flavobacterium sp. J27]
MKPNSSIVVLFLVLTQFLFSQNQNKERELVNGKIISDSLDVENITVFNMSSNIGAVSDAKGKFAIRVRVSDTLFFQALSFVSKKYIITENDFFVDELEIRLNMNVNELDEVVITPTSLTGNLKEDTRKIKIYQLNPIDMNKVVHYEDARFSSGNKITTSPDHFAPNGTGINLKLIGEQIGKWLGIKKNSKKNALEVMEERRLHDIQVKSFADHMKERFSYHFFVSDLKLKKEDITVFLAYAEMPSKTLAEFLKTENELQLIEYLVKKAAAFHQENKEDSILLPNEKE